MSDLEHYFKHNLELSGMDLSAPLHLQALERFLDVNRLLKEVEEAVHDPVPTIKYSW